MSVEVCACTKGVAEYEGGFRGIVGSWHISACFNAPEVGYLNNIGCHWRDGHLGRYGG